VVQGAGACSFSQAGEYEITCTTTLELYTRRYVTQMTMPRGLRFAHERWDEPCEDTIRILVRERD
jgi:hypothetical protein